MIRTIGLILIIVCFIGCTSESKRSSKTFYDVDSLINSQVKLLTEGKMALRKIAYVKGISDTLVIHADSARWSGELDIFRQLDVINRSSFADVYRWEDDVDTRSNLRTRTLTGNATPVPYIRFFYLGDTKDIRKIEARYLEANSLYTSTRDLTLEFDRVHGLPVLHRYRMDGYQRMLMTDSVHFEIDGEVIE